MAAPKCNHYATGGRRVGAGAKPKAATLIKRQMIANKIGSAEYAFAYLDGVMRNSREATEMRIAAAKEILNRVFGKAVEMKVKDEDRERYDAYFKKIETFLKGGAVLSRLRPTRGNRDAAQRSGIEQMAEQAGTPLDEVVGAINTLGEQSAIDLLRDQMQKRERNGNGHEEPKE